MVRVAGELQGSSPVYGSNEKQTIGRRNFVMGIGLLATGGIGAGLVKKLTGSERNTQSHEIGDQSISSLEAEVNIEKLILPNLYKDRPWADPEQLVGLSSEELKELIAMPVGAETETDEGFALMVVKRLELIANAGKTKQDIERARQLGYRVGERDSYGNSLGNYREYINTYYAEGMIDSLFQEKYTDQKFAGADASLKNLLISGSVDFEYGITDELWRNSSSFHVDYNSVELGPSDHERSLLINVTTWLPELGASYIDGRRAEDEVAIIVNANQDTGSKYAMSIQYIGFGN